MKGHTPINLKNSACKTTHILYGMESNLSLTTGETNTETQDTTLLDIL